MPPAESRASPQDPAGGSGGDAHIRLNMLRLGVRRRAWSPTAAIRFVGADAAPSTAGGLDEEGQAAPGKQPRWLKTKRRGRASSRDYARRGMRKAILAQYAQRHQELERAAEKSGLGWQLKAVALVERTEVIFPDLEPWQEAYQELEEELDCYTGWDVPDEANENAKPGEDFEMPPIRNEAGEPFAFAPRTTDADHANDRRSMERALARPLYLALKREGASGYSLPEAALDDGERLGQASERAVALATRACPRLFHFKRQPLGFFPRALPTDQAHEHGRFGDKLFVYPALVIDMYETFEVSGDEKDLRGVAPRDSSGVVDFAWLTQSELVSELEDRELAEYIGHLTSSPFEKDT